MILRPRRRLIMAVEARELLREWALKKGLELDIEDLGRHPKSTLKCDLPAEFFDDGMKDLQERLFARKMLEVGMPPRAKLVG